jgi:hypothetical protein
MGIAHKVCYLYVNIYHHWCTQFRVVMNATMFRSSLQPFVLSGVISTTCTCIRILVSNTISKSNDICVI